MYMPIIGGVKCIVAHPNPQTKFWVGGRPTLQRPHGVYRDRCKLPSGVWAEPRPQSHFAELNALKTHLVAAFWFSGQHCNEWQNESQSRLRSNLVWVSAGNCRHINIIVVETGKLIFVALGSKIAAP